MAEVKISQESEQLKKLFDTWHKEASARRFCIVHIAEEITLKWGTPWWVFVLGVAWGGGREFASLAEINDIWFDAMITSFTPQYGAEQARKIMQDVRARNNCH